MARFFKASIGWRPGSAISACSTACGPPSWSGATARGYPIPAAAVGPPAGFVRELAWLGSELCDYNAPLLAATFSARIDPERFMALWGNITRCLQGTSAPALRFHRSGKNAGNGRRAAKSDAVTWAARSTPSGAYLTHLTGDWETFYTAKRSSATRRRDRTKRKKLGEFGEVKFVNPASDSEILRALDTLMAQKARSFARMGVGNLFAKPGYAEFYRALATDPATRHLVHVSRLDVGATAAAVNLGLTYRELLLSSAGELQTMASCRASDPAPRICTICCTTPSTGASSFRFHHRRRTLQTRLVRYRAEALRLHRAGDLARRARRHADTCRATAQALDQADAGIVERLQRGPGLYRIAGAPLPPLS